jgi:hypothetical protein
VEECVICGQWIKGPLITQITLIWGARDLRRDAGLRDEWLAKIVKTIYNDFAENIFIETT